MMKVQKLIFTKGLSGCGKSTYAKKLVDSDPKKWRRVNKDDIRAMMFNSHWYKGSEKLVVRVRDAIIIESLEAGFSVVVDDTNFEPYHEARFREIAKQLSNDSRKIVVEEQFFDVDVLTCIERDLKRPNSVGEKVIRAQHNKYIVGTDYNKLRQNKTFDLSLPNAIICDLDGTLALYDDHQKIERHYDRDFINDDLNVVVKEFLDRYRDHKLIIFSGRNGKHEAETKRWLEKHNIKYDVFAMRKEGDGRSDVTVKTEMYENLIKDKYNVKFCVDDRKSVIRDCWQHKFGLYVVDVGMGYEF